MKKYFNTTDESSSDVDIFSSLNETQNQKIMKYAIGFGKDFSASSMLKYFSERTPITSIRRALNSLENENRIEKTGEKRKGDFGRNENLYKVINYEKSI